MTKLLSRNFVRASLRAVAVGVALVAGGAGASAAPPTLDFAPAPAATAPIATEGTGSADALMGPGTVLCWLLNPSTTCQI